VGNPTRFNGLSMLLFHSLVNVVIRFFHRALLAIATLTALSAESTGGISKTVVYCGSPFSMYDQA